MSWDVFKVSTEEVHIYPTGDIAAHNFEGRKCQCCPNLKECKRGDIISHNSWDQRENEEAVIQTLQEVASDPKHLL